MSGYCFTPFFIRALSTLHGELLTLTERFTPFFIRAVLST